MHTIIEGAVHLVLRNGGSVSLELNKEKGLIEYDLHTEMKSGLSLYEKDQDVWAITRYDEDALVISLGDVVYTALDCMCAREYAAQAWLDIFNEYNIKV